MTARPVLLGALCAAACGGCGYSLGVQRPVARGAIAVPIFSNRTFPLRRDVEYRLTSALRREVQERTPLVLVADGESDITVYGTVLEFQENVLAEGADDQKLESVISILVGVRIEDYRLRTVREETVIESQPVSISRGETLEAAQERAIENLAEKILLIALDG